MIYGGHIWYGIIMVYGHMVPNMIIIILYTYGMISMIIRYLISCVSYLISYIYEYIITRYGGFRSHGGTPIAGYSIQ